PSPPAAVPEARPMTLLQDPLPTIKWTPPEARAPLPVVPQKTYRKHPWLHRTLRTALVLVLVFTVVTGYSIVGALRAPGTDSTAARLAEWARDHGGTPVVNWMERLTYRRPKVGGTVAGGIVRQQTED